MLIELSNLIITLLVIVMCMYTLVIFGCAIILSSAVSVMMSNTIILRVWNKLTK
jgi:hypothetical protein